MGMKGFYTSSKTTASPMLLGGVVTLVAFYRTLGRYSPKDFNKHGCRYRDITMLNNGAIVKQSEDRIEKKNVFVKWTECVKNNVCNIYTFLIERDVFVSTNTGNGKSFC